MARRLGFQTVPDLKKAVARGIHGYVENGGFLFAMCTATETIDLALAAKNVDIAATFADGTPIDPDADAKLDWSQSFAFTGAHLEPNPLVASFSDIDGHQVNGGSRRQPCGGVQGGALERQRGARGAGVARLHRSRALVCPAAR
jgi:hypothetical protein